MSISLTNSRKDILKTLIKLVNFKQNKSYDDSVKLKRTEMDPVRLGNEAERARERARESLSLTILIKRNQVDDVLLGHVGLPHVLPVLVHLEFFMLDGFRGSF